MEWIITSSLVLPNVLYTPTDCFAWHPLLHSSDWCLKSWLSSVTEKLFWFALNESAPVYLQCELIGTVRCILSFLFGSLITCSALLSDQRCCDQMTNLLFYHALIKSVIGSNSQCKNYWQPRQMQQFDGENACMCRHQTLFCLLNMKNTNTSKRRRKDTTHRAHTAKELRRQLMIWLSLQHLQYSVGELW